jgi:alkylhydroperoxidase family enzyme
MVNDNHSIGWITPPKKINPFILVMIWLSDRITKKELMPPRILSHSTRSAISSGLMEAFAAKKSGKVTERLLKLIRVQVSMISSCPFCIDMNSDNHKKYGITDNEIDALQKCSDPDNILTFSDAEKAALLYCRALTATPVSLHEETKSKLKKNFSEKEIVIIAVTISQVNYWARLIQGFGLPPAGFSDSCAMPNSKQ